MLFKCISVILDNVLLNILPATSFTQVFHEI